MCISANSAGSKAKGGGASRGVGSSQEKGFLAAENIQPAQSEPADGKEAESPEPVVIPLEGEQLRELGPILKAAWYGSRCILADIVRDETGCYLRVITVDRRTWKKLRKVLEKAGESSEQTPTEADGT